MKYKKGFSLIELLIAIVILGMLASIAYPSYTQHIIKTHRIDGQIALMDLAARMEHYYIANNYSYNDITLAALGVKTISPQGFYTLAISKTSATTYTLQATPNGSQQNDTLCGTLTLNQAGQKSQSGNGTVKECW